MNMNRDCNYCVMIVLSFNGGFLRSRLLSIYINFNPHFCWACEFSRIVTVCCLFIVISIHIFIGLRIQMNCYGLLSIYTNFNTHFYWACEFGRIVTVCCLFALILIHIFIRLANSAELSRFAVYLY